MIASGVEASIPTGEKHGRWHVTSITSISGDGAESDAAAGLAQSTDAGELSVRWDERGAVVTSINIRSCYGENEDYSQSYSVESVKWVALSKREAAKRIEADFSTWLDQARLACGKNVNLSLFDMAQLRGAVSAFAARLKRLRGRL